MSLTVSNLKTEADFIEFFADMLRLKELRDKPCTKLTKEGECANRYLPEDQMCENCKAYWEKAAALIGQTVPETLALADKPYSEFEKKMNSLKVK